jgi:hypothetical protein
MPNVGVQGIAKSLRLALSELGRECFKNQSVARTESDAEWRAVRRLLLSGLCHTKSMTRITCSDRSRSSFFPASAEFRAEYQGERDLLIVAVK